MFFLPQLPEIGDIGPADGNQAQDQVGGTQHQGLDAVAILVDPDLFIVGRAFLAGKDKQAQTQATLAAPLGLQAAPVEVGGIMADIPPEDGAQNGLGQTPGALPNDKQPFFHKDSSSLFLSVSYHSTGKNTRTGPANFAGPETI